MGDKLPEHLYRRLTGTSLSDCAEKAILVCTLDPQGLPHPAILSYFEVVARDMNTLRLATYNNSSTTNNMRRNGKLTIVIIDERLAYYIKGTVQELRREMSCSPHNSKLEFRIQQVLADEANEEFEPGVYITSGITYKRSWSQRQAEQMLKELLA